MKVGVLTSSRADYGIYTPLLKKLAQNNFFELELIVFGMHLLENQGFTIKEIENDRFGLIHRVEGMPSSDSKLDIAIGYGTLIKNFAQFWYKNQFDFVLALGDRWEMSAAIQASLPFELTIAHIHGGETTLGAIDNIYRHQITLASKLHFTASEPFAQRVKEIIGKSDGIYTVGSISLENVTDQPLPEWTQVSKEFSIPFDDFILVTVHPESVNANLNKQSSTIIYNALKFIANEFNVLITKSNSDVMGSIYNKQFELLESEYPSKVKIVASLGRLNYFKAMQQSFLLLGNTSSGIIEAASFGKWVINLGDRQKGRLAGENVIHLPFDTDQIVKNVRLFAQKQYVGKNLYYQPNPSHTILRILSGNYADFS